MRRLQMELMPAQMAMQSSTMKPMMFTIIFIIGIFSWMAESWWLQGWLREPSVATNVGNDGYDLLDFPAWVITYIAMSAPGRITDRHIKIIRFGRHPLV